MAIRPDQAWLAALCWALGLVAVLFAPDPVQAASLPDVVARVKPAIVGVGTVLPTRRPAGRFVGTGFVVAGGQHVLTNLHVLPGAVDLDHREYLAVFTTAPSANVRKARVIGRDPDHDLALLRISGKALPTLRLGDSERVREGEIYAFTGFPLGMVLGLHPATHRAMVAAITPIAIPQLSSRGLDAKLIRRLRHPYRIFQLDGTAYPGNSGSPLYDRKTGRVVGVVNKVFVKGSKENALEKPSGISYAIPVSYARRLLEGAGLAAATLAPTRADP